MRQIITYDTTLRDGSQGEGIAYSLMDKIRIAEKLDELGVAFIEGGWPGSNPKDAQFFAKMAKKNLNRSVIVAFGSTRRPDIAASKDRNLQELIASKAKVVTIFGKSWLYHVKDVLRTTPEENLKMIGDSVSFLKANGVTVFYDAEHFFDGYKDNPAYALECLVTAQEAGANCLILCDTNGGTLPGQISAIVRELKTKLRVRLGIHCHNDAGVAVASSIAAVEAGCDMVQGTMNGYGERCGNADLIPIIANLQLKLGMRCIPPENLKKLSAASYFVSEISNVRHMSNQPYVGDSAFAHKGGVHINAVMKATDSYEHIQPEAVGNKRRILLSELGGKSSILLMAKDMNLDLTKDDPKTRKAHALLQSLEMKGYHFEAAEASFELILKRALSGVKEFFSLQNFRVVVNKEKNRKVTTEAIIKIKVNDKIEHTAADGDGPVNALDTALRKALEAFYPSLKEMRLSDYKVRVLDDKPGTAARVRVLVQSQDGRNSWNTIGVSENIIEASWQALLDSIEYKLLKDGEKKRPLYRHSGKHNLDRTR
ncbi:MAG TPA: citramalate synthase [Candidatus Omnitrophota bacterium]|nr:citramalate synthase [Candidatus Omnitrophota bacterium]HRZ15113.1 citramalate synthase [Candidatus Omnitrophota bacterium]